MKHLADRFNPFILGLLAVVAIACSPLPAFAADEAESVVAAPSALPADVAPEGAAAEPHAEAAADAHAEGAGFPQLDARTYPSQLFWLFVSFIVLYALMSKLALPSVAAVLDERKARKDGNLSQAAQMQEESARVKTAYEATLAKAQGDAQETLNEAEAEIAEKMAAENAKFTEAARKRVATAEQNIAKAKADALGSIADISAEIAAEMVGKIAAVQVGKAEAKKAVTAVMQKEAA